MKKSGPKVSGKLAKTGEYCPPASEGARIYRGIRKFRRVCKYGGHEKLHPGRCVECRRLADKKRAMKKERAEKMLNAWRRWKVRPGNAEKVAAYAREYNQREDVRRANAERQRMYRRGERVNKQTDPQAVARRLLAKAENAVRYGIEGKLNLRRI